MNECTCPSPAGLAVVPAEHAADCPEAFVERLVTRVHAELERQWLGDAHTREETAGAIRDLLGALLAEPTEVRARAVGLAARVAELDVEHMVGTPWCPECGPGAQCDEEGLCVVCGATVGVVRAVLVDAERGDG